jgi:hypothetical protein
MQTSRAHKIAATMAEFYARAGEDPELSERMSFANTVIHIRFTDDDTAGCTIWLDRNPIAAEPRLVGDAEIELLAPTSVYVSMVKGPEVLAMAIAKGQATYTGPVRKYLRVVPILRSFDFDMWRGNGRLGGDEPAVVPPSPVS